jgi:hypothetical protein
MRVRCPDCERRRGEHVALLFDGFGTRKVELAVRMWPGFDHGFKVGELSGLYGAVNSDDLFESCELRANVGAEFESEHWKYDISTTSIRVSSEAIQSFEQLDRQIMHLLEETKRFLTPQRVPFLTASRALVAGVIPEGDPEKDVADRLRSKLLSRRITQGSDDAPVSELPGVIGGVGLTLVGDTETYHWHANVGPVHSPTSDLRLSAELYFPPPSEQPEESMISDSLRVAYDFLRNNLVAFAEKSLS